MTNDATRKALETVGGFVSLFADGAEYAGTTAAFFDDVLSNMELDRPPAELKVLAESMNVVEASILEQGRWTAEGFPLGPEGLRDLVLGQILGFIAEQLTVLRDDYLGRVGMNLNTLADVTPDGHRSRADGLNRSARRR
jgi:hypothetical protein